VLGIISVVIAAMPLLGMRTAAIAIIAWFGTLLIRAVLHGSPAHPRWRECALLSIPFLVILLDLLRADPFPNAWGLAERSAALFIFPLGFLVLGAPTHHGPVRFMDVFSLAAAVLAVLANTLLIPHLVAAAEIDASFQHAYRSGFAEVTGVHPPYAAYWFFAGALFQLHGLLAPVRDEGSLIRCARVIILVGCAMAGLLIGSRMPVIAFVIAAVVLVSLRLSRRHALRVGVAIVLTTALAALLSPALRERTKELTGIGTDRRDAEQTSISVRTPVVHCSFSVLKDHWLSGAGQPEVQPALDRCYATRGHDAMIQQGYGPHCQPLQWWLAFGIAGPAAFVVLFGWSMREAWGRKDHIHLAFLVFLFLCCLTEDLLTRQWGVVFFAFFNTVFVATQRAAQPTNSR
jgi:hypothetical protein